MGLKLFPDDETLAKIRECAKALEGNGTSVIFIVKKGERRFECATSPLKEILEQCRNSVTVSKEKPRTLYTHAHFLAGFVYFGFFSVLAGWLFTVETHKVSQILLIGSSFIYSLVSLLYLYRYFTKPRSTYELFLEWKERERKPTKEGYGKETGFK